MGFQDGRLATCDICGASVFVPKKLDERTADPTAKWINRSDIGWMCPSCANKWFKMVKKFKKNHVKADQ